MANDSIARALAISALLNGGGGEGGTTNYSDLSNKPKINGVTLSGNKSLDDLGIHDTTYNGSDSIEVIDGTLYIKDDWINDKLSVKQDTLIAGRNITIEDNVISASGGGSGTDYVAGEGINIEGDTISMQVPIYSEHHEGTGEEITISLDRDNADEIATFDGIKTFLYVDSLFERVFGHNGVPVEVTIEYDMDGDNRTFNGNLTMNTEPEDFFFEGDLPEGITSINGYYHPQLDMPATLQVWTEEVRNINISRLAVSFSIIDEGYDEYHKLPFEYIPDEVIGMIGEKPSFDDVDLMIEEKKLIAGEGINIDEDTHVISATGGSGSYTFTDGLVENDGVVSWKLNNAIKAGNSSNNSVTIGLGMRASGNYSGAIGYAYDNGAYSGSNANGIGSFINGSSNGTNSAIKANAEGSHAEGYTTGSRNIIQVSVGAVGGHAEGYADNTYGGILVGDSNTLKSGKGAHAEGTGTIASSDFQHVEGRANYPDKNGIFQHITGNGTSDSNRSNAEALDWNGNQYLSGNVYVNCTDYSTNASGLVTENAGGNKVATVAEVNSIINSHGGGGSSDGMIELDFIDSESGHISDELYELVKQANSYIKYDGKYYYNMGTSYGELMYICPMLVRDNFKLYQRRFQFYKGEEEGYNYYMSTETDIFGLPEIPELYDKEQYNYLLTGSWNSTAYERSVEWTDINTLIDSRLRELGLLTD